MFEKSKFFFPSQNRSILFKIRRC